MKKEKNFLYLSIETDIYNCHGISMFAYYQSYKY